MDILIVENDTIVAKMWNKKLSKEHTVRTAESVMRAKEEIAEKVPDLVLLDLRLNGPKHSGLNVYEFIRQELKGNTPIIFITGLAYSVELFQKAEIFTEADRAAGIKTSLIEKPVPINALFDIVKDALVA